MEKLTDQELVRRQKMTALKDQGIEPFGQAFTKTHQSAEIFTLYDQYDKKTLAEMAPAVIVAGRIMTKREMGKAGFLHLQDQTGQIQVYLRQDSLTPLEFDLFKSADLGDIIGIAGTVFRTNHGELSIKALKYTHLSKALRPLPEKFHGLIDVEERYRRRYLDLIMNERSRYIALSRTKIIRAIQHYFDALGYIEVETPVLQPILGGAAAKPFVTHHNTLDMDFYLRIATELPLKRLIVGGFEGVYEIGRLFRNEGMSPKHNPEFTTVEVYIAYIDMLKMMEVTEQLVEAVSLEVLKTTELTYGEIELSLKAPFKRIHMVDAIKQVTGIDFWTIKDDKTALELAKSHQIPLLSHQATLGHVINAFFEYYVEATIIQPTFVYGHPVDISPLAKRNSEDGRFTDRFELIIAGREYANAFSELNDPIDQKQRFLNQIKEKELGNEEASEMDIDFVEALEYGMPPTAGMGLGIDRLVMLLTNSESIREVILFPHMKHRSE